MGQAEQEVAFDGHLPPYIQRSQEPKSMGADRIAFINLNPGDVLVDGSGLRFERNVKW